MTINAEGKRSGVPIEQQIPVVLTIRDGKVVRSETHGSVDGALEAAGLSEQLRPHPQRSNQPPIGPFATSQRVNP